MADDFHTPPGPIVATPSPFILELWQAVLSAPPVVFVTILLAPALVLIITRLTSERPSRILSGSNERTVWRLPYLVPWFGQTIKIGGDSSSIPANVAFEGIFAQKLNGKNYNIISDLDLAKSAVSQKRQDVESYALAWRFASKVFGLQNKLKYDKLWPELAHMLDIRLQSGQLSGIHQTATRYLQTTIPSMLSFIESDIDLESWERSARTTYISASEVEVDLITLMRDMLCHASISSIFGRGLLDKYPNIIKDIITMDDNQEVFLRGLPAVSPWPGVFQAHMARRNLWEVTDEHQRQLDKKAKGEETDYSWGYLHDVSELVLERNKLWRENNFSVKERGDLSLLWALVTSAPHIAAYHLLQILNTKDLLPKIRAEISPHLRITAPTRIGSFSSPPTLQISREGLASRCPLFRSTYLETLRLYSTPQSVRNIEEDVVISRSDGSGESFRLRKGEGLIIPHELHLRSAKYFSSPDKYVADRFLSNPDTKEQSSLYPFSGNELDIHEGRIIGESESMALVAGVLMMWDFEPVVNERGRQDWTMPRMKRAMGVMRPKGDVRVRVRRRLFDWDDTEGNHLE